MTKYIAEIGVNHLGDPKLGFQLVKKAASSGVHGISMQILLQKDYDNLKPWRRKIHKKFYKKVASFLKKKKISFGFGVYDANAVQNFSDIKIDFWKIISYHFYDENLIKTALKTNKTVYLSTGIASMADIKKYSKKYKKVNFIHTTLSKNISPNMLAIQSIKKNVKNKVSFGLHSAEDEMIISAISLKADPIFFYIKNNDNRYYPDNTHAIKVDELPKKIKLWKKINFSMGNGIKKRLKTPSWVYE